MIRFPLDKNPLLLLNYNQTLISLNATSSQSSWLLTSLLCHYAGRHELLSLLKFTRSSKDWPQVTVYISFIFKIDYKLHSLSFHYRDRSCTTFSRLIRKFLRARLTDTWCVRAQIVSRGNRLRGGSLLESFNWRRICLNQEERDLDSHWAPTRPHSRQVPLGLQDQTRARRSRSAL